MLIQDLLKQRAQLQSKIDILQQMLGKNPNSSKLTQRITEHQEQLAALDAQIASQQTKTAPKRIIDDDSSDHEVRVPLRPRTTIVTAQTDLSTPTKPVQSAPTSSAHIVTSLDFGASTDASPVDDNDEIDQEIQSRHKETVPLQPSNPTVANLLDSDLQHIQSSAPTSSSPPTPIFNRRKSINPRKSLHHTTFSSPSKPKSLSTTSPISFFDDDAPEASKDTEFEMKKAPKPEDPPSSRPTIASDSEHDTIVIKRSITSISTQPSLKTQQPLQQSKPSPKPVESSTKSEPAIPTSKSSSTNPDALNNFTTQPAKKIKVPRLLASDDSDGPESTTISSKTAQASSSTKPAVVSAQLNDLLGEIDDIPDNPFKPVRRVCSSDEEDQTIFIQSISANMPKGNKANFQEAPKLTAKEAADAITRANTLATLTKGLSGVTLQIDSDEDDYVKPGGVPSSTPKKSGKASTSLAAATPLKTNVKSTTIKSALHDEAQSNHAIPAFLNFDNMLENMYTHNAASYNTHSSSSSSQVGRDGMKNKDQHIKPSMMYLRLLLSSMVDISNLDQSYSPISNPKAKGKAAAPTLVQDSESNYDVGVERANFTGQIQLFNHLFPPFLRLKPLPHQVYSFFWLIAHERDHDYFLYRYNSTVSQFFNKLLANRRTQFPIPGNRSNVPVEQVYQTDLLMTSSLLSSHGVQPHSLPLTPEIDLSPHLPLLSGGMLCDDCGLGKTYQLITLTASDAPRIGLMRGYEWIRLTLRHLQRKKITQCKEQYDSMLTEYKKKIAAQAVPKCDEIDSVNDSNTESDVKEQGGLDNVELTPKQLAEVMYDGDVYMQRLSTILYELSLFLTTTTDSIHHRRGLGVIPQISTRTQLYMYVCSLFPFISRNYSINRKNATFSAQYDLLCDILAYIGIDTALLPHFPQAISQSAPISVGNPRSLKDQPKAVISKSRIIINSDSDDDTPQLNSKQQQLNSSQAFPLPSQSPFQSLTITNKDKLPHLRMLESCPLCHDNNEHKVGGLYGATLVVCVKSVMTQWEQEIKAICGTHPFPAQTLYNLLSPEFRTAEHKKYLNSFPPHSDGSEDIPLCNVFLYHANTRLQLFNNAWDYEGQVDEMREKYADSTICSCAPRYSFVVTTYETLRSDYNRFLQRETDRAEAKEQKREEKRKSKLKAAAKGRLTSHCDDSDDNEDEDDEEEEDQIELSEITLQDVTWGRIVFDECHKVKNASTQNYKAAFELMTCNDVWYDECVNHEQALLSQYQKLSSKSHKTKDLKIEGLLDPNTALTVRPGGRYCVSATPLHNSEADLFSLIKLLRFRPYNKKRVWETVLERDKQNQKSYQERGQQAPPGLLWAIIQSCMIRRERTEKNDPKYAALIHFLQNGLGNGDSTPPRAGTSQSQKKSEQRIEFKVKDEARGNQDNDDDLDALLSGMSRMNINGEEERELDAKPIKSEQHIPSKSEWNVKYQPTLLLHIPTGPQTPDKPLFVKHFVKQSPVEQDLYQIVSKFAKSRLELGENISLEDPAGADLEHLDRTALGVFSGSGKSKKHTGGDNDGELIPMGKKSRKTKPNYNYANALQVLQLLQQCSSSVFFLTPNFIPLTFNLLRFNMRTYIEGAPVKDRAVLEANFGLDMVAKRPKALVQDPNISPGELNHLMLFIRDEYDSKTGVTNGDQWDSSDDECYDFETKISINANTTPTSSQTKAKRPVFIDSEDEEDDLSNLANALGNLSLSNEQPQSSSSPSPNSVEPLSTISIEVAMDKLTKKSPHSSLVYKKQPFRPVTFLQMVDMYRRLLLTSRIKSPTNTVFLDKMQNQIAYIKPKYTSHRRDIGCHEPHQGRVPTYGYSSKMAYLLYLLTYIAVTQPGASVIIFSQYTRTLDIIEHALANHSGYFNSYLHQYTNNTTTWCNRCEKQRPLYPNQSTAPKQPTPPTYPKQGILDSSGNAAIQASGLDYPTPTREELKLDLSYLDETSVRTVLHSLQMPSYVSYCDTDLYAQSLTTICNCGTCNYVKERVQERRGELNFDDDKPTTEVLTQLRPHEELYYEAQEYSTPSIIRCPCCLDKVSSDKKAANHSPHLQLESALSRFNGFASISRIDGSQGKDEQEQQKKAFKKPVSTQSLSHTTTSLTSFEYSHTCQCKVADEDKFTADQIKALADRFQSAHSQSQPLPLNLMLISLKAGGVGLNLVEASHVILFEANWNPMDRFQAMCRCIRNFQTKTVFVHELCTLGTIEEKVFTVRQNKRLLSKQIVETGAIGTNRQALQMTLSDISSILDDSTK